MSDGRYVATGGSAGVGYDARRRLVDRSRYLFGVPSTRVSVGAIAVLALGAGLLVAPGLRIAVVVGVALIAGPALVAMVATGPIEGALGGTIAGDRSAFLALAMGTVETGFVLAGATVGWLAAVGPRAVVDAALIGAAGTFAFRWLVLLSVSGPSLRRRLPAAAVQPAATVVAAVFLALPPVGFPIGGREVLLTTLVAVGYGGIVVALVELVERPFAGRIGLGAFEFLQGFIEHVAGRSAKFEAILREVGEPATVPVSVLTFETPAGREKARVVVPLAHPGPFRDVGGGLLPDRLAATGDGVTFVPHALADHAFNPASRRDVEAIREAAERAVEDATVAISASVPIVAGDGDATVTAQRFGDDPWLVTTFAPAPTDDVDGRVGRAILERTRAAAPIVTDAHNAVADDGTDVGRVLPGDERAETLQRAVERAMAALDGADTGPLEVGVAVDESSFGGDEGIGRLGVRVLTTRVADVTAAYVLVDGNNMDPTLREAIRSAIGESAAPADVVTVSTTDSHRGNYVDGEPHVGKSVDWTRFAERIGALVEASVEDLEPCRAATGSAATTVTLLGSDPIDEIAAVTDDVLPRAGAFVGLASVGVTAVGIALFALA